MPAPAGFQRRKGNEADTVTPADSRYWASAARLKLRRALLRRRVVPLSRDAMGRVGLLSNLGQPGQRERAECHHNVAHGDIEIPGI